MSPRPAGILIAADTEKIICGPGERRKASLEEKRKRLMIKKLKNLNTASQRAKDPSKRFVSLKRHLTYQTVQGGASLENFLDYFGVLEKETLQKFCYFVQGKTVIYMSESSRISEQSIILLHCHRSQPRCR